MIPREKVEELASAHARLDEPATGAIWINTGAPEVWLVEQGQPGARHARSDCRLRRSSLT
jgi:hypothetical protein